MKLFLGAAVVGTLLGCREILAATPSTEANSHDAMFEKMAALLDTKLNEQRTHYERLLEEQQESAQALLRQQQDAYEQQLVQLHRSVGALAEEIEEVEDPREVRRRHLASLVADLSDYSGVDIKREKAGLRLGPDGDVQLLRTSLGQLMILANVNVTGDLWLNSVNSTSVNIGNFVADSSARVAELEASRQYCKASLEFGASWLAAYGTAKVPFGATGATLFDRPITAAPGYGRLVDGVFTAPEDGVYFMASKIRVKDSSTSSIEIQFSVNNKDADGFEMWITTGDASNRRSGLSAVLVQLKEGDVLYPKSDLTTASGVMGSTDVIQIPKDRIAFNVRSAGANSSAALPLVGLYDEKEAWVSPPEFSGVLQDGIFTAPRAGLYYFVLKERVQDNTIGDMEIEWKKNGADTEGGFEMWMHTGDTANRRSHISSTLMQLDAGDYVYPISDIGTTNIKNVVMSGFELSPDLPAFKVYNTASFSFTTSATAFGKGATVTTDFEVGSSGAYKDGVYTVPESGIYYFTTKLRTGDNDNGDIEIEWKKNGNDASTINYEMWLHLGDSSNRRSGMSATLLECLAGDKVYATSDATLTGSGDIIAQWTFSGFKVR